jgi:serine/threonine protein kinase
MNPANGQTETIATAAKLARDSEVLLNNRYRIVRELGAGGFARVFEAQDQTLLSRRVVVKVLQNSKDDPWFLRKFDQEMEALTRIDDPRVVAIFDAGKTPEGAPFLVLQYVDGITLRKMVKKGGIDLPLAAEIFRQIGCGLEAAHKEHVYHRDLKPENIMLQSGSDDEPRVRLIDFGVAGIADSVFGGSDVSRVAGTLRYMPPEQLEGKVSPETDIYAFATLAFELLTGVSPFANPTQRVTLGDEALDRRIRDLRPEVPEGARRILLKAMAIDPQHRYQSARDMGDLLSQSLSPDGSSTTRQQDSGEGDRLEIAHVLFLDIVGYSLLSMADQKEYGRMIKDIVRQAPHFVEAEKRSELITIPTGDGLALVFFGDPTCAAESAMEIARAVGLLKRFQLRIGLHTGPVYRVQDINKNRNVSGGGINIAQRVMDAGDPGHILVSGGLAEMLSEVGGWKGWLTDLGEHPLKHEVPLRFFNLCSGDVGNPAWPSKWKKPARLRLRTIGLLALLLVAAAGVGAYLKSKPSSAPVLPKVTSANLDLRYFITVQRSRLGKKPPATPIRLAKEMIFREDDEIAITVNAPAPGFLYILNDGPLPDGTPSINVIYPAPGATARIAAGEAIRIPKSDWIGLDAASGTEKVYLAWSANSVFEFEAAKNRTDSLTNGGVVIRDPDQLTALRGVLSRYLIGNPQISKDEDSKTTFLTSTKDVLVHLIRLEHE